MQQYGIGWFRKRQRVLSRGVVAAFFLAWLQVAALPCANAFVPGVSTVDTAEQRQAPHHVGSSMAADSVAVHCPYCPPDDSPRTGTPKLHGTCSYPHSPQVDSRLATLFTLVVPVAAPLAWITVQADVGRPGLVAEPAPVPPRTPLDSRPARLIE